MVFPAQPGEVPPRGRSAGGEVDLGVIELEITAALAPFDITLAAAHDHRGTHLRRDMTAEMGDGLDVAAVLDHRGKERGTEQFSRPCDVHRPDAGDLAPLALDRVTPHQRGVIDHHVHGVLHTLRLGVAQDEVHQRVSQVRLARFGRTAQASMAWKFMQLRATCPCSF